MLALGNLLRLTFKFEMIDEKFVTCQIIEYQQISSETSSEGLEMNDRILASSLIEELPVLGKITRITLMLKRRT